jgi:hypothetical protein
VHPYASYSFFRSGKDGEEYLGLEWTRGGWQEASMAFLALLQGQGQKKANNMGWPTFNGKFVNYTKFKQQWKAYHT